MRFFSISVILNIFLNWVRVLNIFRNWARVLNIFQNWASVLNIFRNWVRVLNIFQNWVRPKKSRRRPQIAKRWLLASGPSAPIFHEESESEIRSQKFQPVPEIWLQFDFGRKLHKVEYDKKIIKEASNRKTVVTGLWPIGTNFSQGIRIWNQISKIPTGSNRLID